MIKMIGSGERERESLESSIAGTNLGRKLIMRTLKAMRLLWRAVVVEAQLDRRKPSVEWSAGLIPGSDGFHAGKMRCDEEPWSNAFFILPCHRPIMWGRGLHKHWRLATYTLDIAWPWYSFYFRLCMPLAACLVCAEKFWSREATNIVDSIVKPCMEIIRRS